MTDTNSNSHTDALLKEPEKTANPTESTIGLVFNEFGVHPLRQMKEILLMRMGAQKLGSNEYYDLRVFDPAHNRTAKRQFLGQGGINALNLKLNPDTLMETKNFVGNKLVYTHHLNAAGIASTQTQAMVTDRFTSEQELVLKDVAEVTAFLHERAVFPIFGKPLGGSLSVGSARIDGIEGGTLRLANGKTLKVEDFAQEVLHVFTDGYLMQTALVPHKDMARITGDAIGSVRVVTTHDGSVAKPAYAVWKIPAENATSDNFWQDGSMLALVNLADGVVINCHRGKGPNAELLQEHPKSQFPVVGFQLPHWQEVLRNACAAHDLSPDLGVCGFDVAITDEGPVILECNDNPNHMLYQFPARRGIRNPDLNPTWKSLIARKRKR